MRPQYGTRFIEISLELSWPLWLKSALRFVVSGTLGKGQKKLIFFEICSHLVIPTGCGFEYFLTGIGMYWHRLAVFFPSLLGILSTCMLRIANGNGLRSSKIATSLGG